MSRAFMKETDGMFHCNLKDRDCPEANLRGGCDLPRCRDDEFVSVSKDKSEHKNEEVH